MSRTKSLAGMVTVREGRKLLPKRSKKCETQLVAGAVNALSKAYLIYLLF
jgi:hypothetical protein